MTSELFIGLMSGTSADGIDVALVSIDTDGVPLLINSLAVPHQPDVRAAIETIVQSEQTTMEQAADFDIRLGHLFAQAALAIVPADSTVPITAIGSHGQTVLHRPQNGFSIQLGSGAIIAEATGITTVCDFRARDLAAFGQGAPLVPAFHQALFAQPQVNVAVVNIGGISNVTLLPASENGHAQHDVVSGFDCGPGNTLMDLWTRRHIEQDMDIDGAFAASGTVNMALLKRMKQDSYFTQAAPKSTGREYFNSEWLDSNVGAMTNLPAADVQATLASLTAQTIAEAITGHFEVEQVLVCGGGVHNKVVMRELNESLPCDVKSTSAVGVSPDDIEAMAFAWLAWARLNNVAANVPAVTGARRHAVLGCVWPGW